MFAKGYVAVLKSNRSDIDGQEIGARCIQCFEARVLQGIADAIALRLLRGAETREIVVFLFQAHGHRALQVCGCGEGDELVAKMKIEEERIAEERKLNKLISSLPSGVLVSFDGTDNFKLSDELYEAVCKATKLIPQRAIMGANFLNFRAHEIYTINGNKIDETFVKWDDEKNKCFAGFVVSGNNVGVDETVKVSGEALSFLSTGIDTRVYFIKNF